MKQFNATGQSCIKRKPVSSRLMFWIRVQNKEPMSYLAGNVRQLVEREDSQPAYPIYKPLDETINLTSGQFTAYVHRTRMALNRSNSSLPSILQNRTTLMFSFTAEANDTSRRADPVADLDRSPFVPAPIGPSDILNTYNVYPFAHSNGVRLTLLSLVSHSRF